MTAALTPSEKALIADMADVLIAADIDLGDERSVEMALRFGYMADRPIPTSTCPQQSIVPARCGSWTVNFLR